MALFSPPAFPAEVEPLETALEAGKAAHRAALAEADDAQTSGRGWEGVGFLGFDGLVVL